MADRVDVHPGPLNHLLTSPTGGIATALLRTGIRVQTEARRRCPVDTGRLRSSIGVTLTAAPAGFAVTVGTNVAYARYVHDGTRHMRARPFLTDALTSVLAAGIR